VPHAGHPKANDPTGARSRGESTDRRDVWIEDVTPGLRTAAVPIDPLRSAGTERNPTGYLGHAVGNQCNRTTDRSLARRRTGTTDVEPPMTVAGGHLRK
jgi:hypothetical protein